MQDKIIRNDISSQTRRFRISKRTVLLLIVAGLFLFALIAVVHFFFSRPNIGKEITSGDQSRVERLKSGRLRSEVPSSLKQEEGRVSTTCFSYQYSTQYSPKVEEVKQPEASEESEQREQSCVVRASLFEPKGQLTVSWKELREDQLFKDDTGIQHRIRNKESFRPISITTDQFPQTTAFIGEKETTVFVHIRDGVLVISIHEFLGTDEEAIDIAKSILNSMEFPS